MSDSTAQSKTCAQCTGYDATKTGCYHKPYDTFWGYPTVQQVKPTDSACHLYKSVELPELTQTEPHNDRRKSDRWVDAEVARIVLENSLKNATARIIALEAENAALRARSYQGSPVLR